MALPSHQDTHVNMMSALDYKENPLSIKKENRNIATADTNYSSNLAFLSSNMR